MTIRQIIDIAKKEKIDYIDCKTLIKYVLNKDNNYIIVNQDTNLSKEQEKKYMKLVKKVKAGCPIQYITNKQEFMGLEFYVDENVLIPQPDTEILVNYAIDYTKNKDYKILDLCTGSGAIGISIKKYLPQTQITVSDISSKALEVAKKNAKIHNVDIEFIQSDMFENIKDRYDLIISNPPYIKNNIIKTLPLDVQKEPVIALDGGTDGLKFYRIIQQSCKQYLKDNGVLILEIGYDQKEDIMNLFKNVICLKDYENRDRVIVWNLSQDK